MGRKSWTNQAVTSGQGAVPRVTVDAAEIVALRVAHLSQLRILQQIIVAVAHTSASRRPPMLLDNGACRPIAKRSLHFSTFREFSKFESRGGGGGEVETEINANAFILIFDSPGATRLGLGRSSR